MSESKRAGASSEPSAWDWRREADVYPSGLLEDLWGGLGAPSLYAVEERPGEVRLWLEEIAEAQGSWSPDRYELAARQLGRMNGVYLAGRPLPDAPWRSRDTLRSWGDGFAELARGLAQAEQDPVVGPYCVPELGAAARRLQDDRHPVLGGMRRLPHTFQHGDARRGNLLDRDSAGGCETVAVDWAFCGIRAVGEELESLVSGASMFFEIEHDQLDELSDRC
jgi:hypothetical protein